MDARQVDKSVIKDFGNAGRRKCNGKTCEIKGQTDAPAPLYLTEYKQRQ
jgi:hypothetical protein